MTTTLRNYLGGQWQPEAAPANRLLDPVTGTEIAVTGGAAQGLPEGFDFARRDGRLALQEMTYAQRAAMLGEVAKVLKANRDAYYEIALTNSGTTKSDSAVDIEGASYTLGYYAKIGAALGDARFLLDGEAVALSADKQFQSQHVSMPASGLALFINAFNFPAWGLWEKAAPALLSGVPVVVKPATVTGWLTYRMVQDVVQAGVLPVGALSIVCGSSAGLLDALKPFDVLSFTGSAATAAIIRSHRAVAHDSVRTNIEADSLNASILGPDAALGSDAFNAWVSVLVQEMTIKSGQRCTAVRRALVPVQYYRQVADAVAARLSAIAVGNPRNESVQMGSLVSREQLDSVQAGIRTLRAESELLFDGATRRLVDADPAIAACVAPTLLGICDADHGRLVHDHEVFGPVATLIGYRDTAHAIGLASKGCGSLVTSLYSADDSWLATTALALSACNGRVHAVSPAVAKVQTGPANVMPASIHGGPGRAGGGEELGGLRALAFYHQRTAIQGPVGMLEKISATRTVPAR